MSLNNINPMLLIDFYKATHDLMLPKNMTKSVSYYTSRMSRIKRWDKAVFFGLQGTCKEYLIKYFNENFIIILEQHVFSSIQAVPFHYYILLD